MLVHEPEITFHTGDLVSRGESQEEYKLFHSICAHLYRQCPFFPAKGNHERNRDLYLSNFPQLNNQSYYAVEHDSLYFVILDSTLDLKPGSEQYQWLNFTLAGTSLPVIVIMHHPVFSSGSHGDELGLAMFLPATFGKTNVKAVFAAHDHGYERSLHKGIYYITTAGAGAPMYEHPRKNEYSQLWLETYNYCIGERKGNLLGFKVYGLDDRLLDSFDIGL